MKYRYSMPDRERSRIRHWGSWLKQSRPSQYAAFAKAMKAVEYRLTFEAEEWGEQYEDFHAMKLQMRFGAEDMVGVNYGVHEATCQVFIRNFRWIGPGEPPEQV